MEKASAHQMFVARLVACSYDKDFVFPKRHRNGQIVKEISSDVWYLHDGLSASLQFERTWIMPNFKADSQVRAAAKVGVERIVDVEQFAATIKRPADESISAIVAEDTLLIVDLRKHDRHGQARMSHALLGALNGTRGFENGGQRGPSIRRCYADAKPVSRQLGAGAGVDSQCVNMVPNFPGVAGAIKGDVYPNDIEPKISHHISRRRGCAACGWLWRRRRGPILYFVG